MNALLISPEFPDTFWSGRHALRFVRKKAALPPLGLLTVAALLPTEWKKRLVDVNVRDLSDEDLDWADTVFIGAMAIQQKGAQQILRRCRRSGVRIVAGGPLFVTDREQFPEVDHFLLNEAEATLPAFLTDLEEGRARRVYECPDYPDLAETPIPLWELVDLDRYYSMSIQFSRGCPFDCDFCNVTAMFGRRPRTKSADQIIAELDCLYELGWRSRVFFVDDNLIGNKRQLRTKLLPALSKWQEGKKGIPFNTEVSINIADDDSLMQLMVDAGFDTVFVGIETPDEQSLAECGKTQNARRNLVEDVKRIQRAGLQVQGGFILGFDSDTTSIFRRQIELIQNSGIATAMVGLLQAPPGTRLYRRLRREKRLVGGISGDNVDGSTNIIPRMDRETLQEGYRTVLRHIYAPEHYYRRVRTFLREFKLPKVKSPIGFPQLLTSLRSVLYLGIVGRGRVHYWKLMLWTLFRRPTLLPIAITLSINGYHYRRICELYIL